MTEKLRSDEITLYLQDMFERQKSLPSNIDRSQLTNMLGGNAPEVPGAPTYSNSNSDSINKALEQEFGTVDLMEKYGSAEYALNPLGFSQSGEALGRLGQSLRESYVGKSQDIQSDPSFLKDVVAQSGTDLASVVGLEAPTLAVTELASSAATFMGGMALGLTEMIRGKVFTTQSPEETKRKTMEVFNTVIDKFTFKPEQAAELIDPKMEGSGPAQRLKRGGVMAGRIMTPVYAVFGALGELSKKVDEKFTEMDLPNLGWVAARAIEVFGASLGAKAGKGSVGRISKIVNKKGFKEFAGKKATSREVLGEFLQIKNNEMISKIEEITKNPEMSLQDQLKAMEQKAAEINKDIPGYVESFKKVGEEIIEEVKIERDKIEGVDNAIREEVIVETGMPKQEFKSTIVGDKIISENPLWNDVYKEALERNMNEREAAKYADEKVPSKKIEDQYISPEEIHMDFHPKRTSGERIFFGEKVAKDAASSEPKGINRLHEENIELSKTAETPIVKTTEVKVDKTRTPDGKIKYEIKEASEWLRQARDYYIETAKDEGIFNSIKEKSGRNAYEVLNEIKNEIKDINKGLPKEEQIFLDTNDINNMLRHIDQKEGLGLIGWKKPYDVWLKEKAKPEGIKIQNKDHVQNIMDEAFANGFDLNKSMYIPGISELIARRKMPAKLEELYGEKLLEDARVLRKAKRKNKMSYDDILDKIDYPKEMKDQIRYIAERIDLIKKAEALEKVPHKKMQPDKLDWDDPGIARQELRRVTKRDGTIVEFRRPAVTQKRAQGIRNTRELKTSPKNWQKAFETPLQTFEYMGEWSKRNILDEYIKNEDIAARQQFDFAKEVKSVRKKVSKKEMDRIYQRALYESGEFKVLQDMGIKEIPRLTPNEKGTLDYVTEKFKEFRDEANKIREYIGEEPLKEKSPFLFFREITLADRLGMGLNVFYSKAEIIDGMIKARSAGFRLEVSNTTAKKLALETDMLHMLHTYGKKHIRYKNLTPQMKLLEQSLKELTPTKGEKGKLSEYKPNSAEFLERWKEHILKSYNPEYSGISRAVSTLNKNMAFAVLSWNARSAVVQVTALKGTLIEVGPRYLAEGLALTLKGVWNKSVREAPMQKSKVLFQRIMDIMLRDGFENMRSGKISGIRDAVGQAGFWPLKTLDAITAKITWNAAYLKATKGTKKIGKMSEAEAIRYADTTVIRTQGAAMPGLISPIQRVPLGKFATAFQTFVINDWNFLTRDVLGIGSHKPMTFENFKKAATYVGTSALINIVYEDMFGITSPNPRPLHEFIESREQHDEMSDTLKKVSGEFLSIVPGFGGLRYGSSILGANVDLIRDIGAKAFSDQYVSESWPVIAGKLRGIPGTSQLNKMIKAKERGEKDIFAIIFGQYEKPGKILDENEPRELN